jgi:CubicO group peptidase (beta-lactamase class C family)
MLGPWLIFCGLAGASVEEDRLAEQLEAIRHKHDAPALGVGLVSEGEVLVTGAVGERRRNTEVPVTVDDHFHIGSCAKSLTALIAARLVEAGKLSWKTPLSEAFPERSIHETLRGVTLAQLLRHRSGLAANARGALWGKLRRQHGSPREQRQQLLDEILSREPVAVPGRRYLYSNLGYAVAGSVMEAVTAKSFEELAQELVFEPLGLTSGGFGAPGEAGDAIGQPRGHRATLLGLQAVEPGPRADNPPAYAPAGTVHMSLRDFARYAAFHLREMRGGKDATLARSSREMLYEPIDASATEAHSMGWTVVQREWAGGRAYHHAGSNTMFFAVLWLAPEKDRGLVAVTNRAGKSGFAACDEAIGLLIELSSAGH